jgi:hypothetical protein
VAEEAEKQALTLLPLVQVVVLAVMQILDGARVAAVVLIRLEETLVESPVERVERVVRPRQGRTVMTPVLVVAVHQQVLAEVVIIHHRARARTALEERLEARVLQTTHLAQRVMVQTVRDLIQLVVEAVR